jgi:hypothetical protein
MSEEELEVLTKKYEHPAFSLPSHPESPRAYSNL